MYCQLNHTHGWWLTYENCTRVPSCQGKMKSTVSHTWKAMVNPFQEKYPYHWLIPILPHDFPSYTTKNIIDNLYPLLACDIGMTWLHCFSLLSWQISFRVFFCFFFVNYFLNDLWIPVLQIKHHISKCSCHPTRSCHFSRIKVGQLLWVIIFIASFYGIDISAYFLPINFKIV